MCFCFFKQKTAYEMRISDWSSDVCSSDLAVGGPAARHCHRQLDRRAASLARGAARPGEECEAADPRYSAHAGNFHHPARSEEHTSELQSLMRISYAVFCLKKKSTE